MDVRLAPEQEALRDAAARVVDQLGPHAVGEIGDLERRAKLDAAVDASGWRELRTATESGAPLASGVEAHLVAEEFGRGLADVPFLGPTLANELRRLAGAPPSEGVETVALVADLSSLACTVDVEATSGVAVDGQGSSLALLLMSQPGGSQLAHIALESPEVGADLTRPSKTFRSPVAVTPLASALRTITEDDLRHWTALGLALTCADLVGTMGGAVHLAATYAAQRRQYDVPIGSFQAVQHMLADAFVVTEGARSITLHAAWAVDALSAGEALAAAAVAKAYCARAAREVCETAIQVHGGIGNTWECLAHVYLRRALLSCDVLGDAGFNLARVLSDHGIEGRDGLR
ncbi:MAG: acyl-CoA dehydrogenase family protein [Acidimicrobiales bacterium]